jgi:putative transposase
MDEAVITIRDKKFWLLRANEADGDVLDILVQARRNTKAAKRFFSQLVKQFCKPRGDTPGQMPSACGPTKLQK